MCSPAAAAPSHDIGLYCSDKEIFMSLEKIMSGSPFPNNVISDVNPYQHMPANLPDGIWFFIRSKVCKDAHFGYWRTKGEACQIFSNSSITGWRSTLEFYEGQAPHGHKTDWVMQEYWIARKTFKDNNEKDNSLLCNVFFVGEQKPNHENPQNMAQADMVSQSVQSGIQKTESYTGQGSTSNPQMHEDNETGKVTIRERVPPNHVDIVPEIDYVSGGDYLELRDLDLEIPASRSSSSDSSCVTMSSDECFDALDLLQDLDSEKILDLVQNNAGCKLSVFASSKPTELVMCPASTGTLDTSLSEEMRASDRSVPGSAIRRETPDKKVLNDLSRNQKPDSRTEGTSSASRVNQVVSLSGNMSAVEEDRKATRGRMKKLKKKYFCFMPF